MYTRPVSSVHSLFSQASGCGQNKAHSSLRLHFGSTRERQCRCRNLILLLRQDREVNGSSRETSVLMCLDFRPTIELSYHTSWTDPFQTRKKFNAEFLNCKPTRFLEDHIVWLGNRNFREAAGDKVLPKYRKAMGGFCTISLTGEENELKSPCECDLIMSIRLNKLIVIAASAAVYPDGHALATISMTFLKDYKKPPFSKSRQANPVVKPLPSMLGSSATAHVGTLATSAYSSSPSTCDEPQLPEHYWRSSLSESGPSPSFQISSPPRRSATSVSLVQKNSRTTPVPVPRSRSNNYLYEAPARPIAYDQNHPPGGPSSLPTFVKTRPATATIQQDTIQDVDQDMTPAIFGAPLARISSELPEASHHDRPCFVSDFPSGTNNPCQPCISQPSQSQATSTTGVKRRLGMGRTTGGYSNKKFRPPI